MVAQDVLFEILFEHFAPVLFEKEAGGHVVGFGDDAPQLVVVLSSGAEAKALDDGDLASSAE